MDLFATLDPRLAGPLRAEFERRRQELVEPLPAGVTVVLAGHRAAGKTSLLPHVASWLGRTAIDLDRELEQRAGRPLSEWVEADEASFRRAEREVYQGLPRGVVVAVGGGFLASHADLARGAVVVLVPVSFETYVDRLRADTTRPRLRRMLALDEELREVYFEREEKHRAARPLSFVDFALRATRGGRPRRVVTLPPDTEAWGFAWRAKHAGADLLEIRTDLTAPGGDLRPVARALPLVFSERGAPVPPAWLAIAELVDRPLGTQEPATLLSLHATEPLSTVQALQRWAGVPRGSFVKHVEPLGPPERARRLLETQHALIERFGADRVTVLATGPGALPFRAVLARRNALDYLALDAGWAAAEGQRFVADAAREWRRPSHDGLTERLGILGVGIAGSRSPRVHPQPFDRIELPRDTELGPLLAAMLPHYRALAVTAPFKRAAAKAVGSTLPAVNTLVRAHDAWTAHNTDVAGARAALLALGPGPVGVLGDGGATAALREAALTLNLELDVRTLATAAARPLPPRAVWTWVPDVEPPPGLSLEGCTVAVIAYGAAGRKVAERVRALGGRPLRVGHRWFVAQAREQRALWGRR